MSELKQKKGIMAWIERIGNKLPNPFFLFIYLSLFTIVLSFILSKTTGPVTNPTTGDPVVINSLLTRAGLAYMLTSAVKNFTDFAPLGLVLTMALGIGLAEDVGLIQAAMRRTISGTSDTMLIFIVAVVGICANIASDAGQVIVPLVAGSMFFAMGKHPLVGIALGYAAATAGFTANLFPTGTDALIAGITNSSVGVINQPEINILANYFFMIASTFFIAVVLTFITKKIVEPKLGTYNPAKGSKMPVPHADLTQDELAGLKIAGRNILIYLAVIVAAAIPQNSFLRNAKTGSLINAAPLFQGIVPILLGLFLIGAIPYGRKTGKIKSQEDIVKLLYKAIHGMVPFIVLAFIMGQFIAFFNWTKMGLYLAIVGADFLRDIGFVGIPLFIAFILITFLTDMFLGSGSAKWAIMAPIFVPMFFYLGYSPAWSQLIYRIGDSPANALTPLSAYLYMIIEYMKEYDKDAGVGTALAIMTPYSLITLGAWIVLMIVWFLLNLPIGIGAFIHV